MKDKYARFVIEIVAKGDLDEFENTLVQIVNKIKESNCKIATRTDSSVSSCSQSIDNSTNSIIRISLKNKRDDSKELIWDILHEYGHLLSGVRTANQSDLEREIEAWEFAKLELNQYSELLSHIEYF